MVKGIRELESSFLNLTRPSLPDLVLAGGGEERHPHTASHSCRLNLLLGLADHSGTKCVLHQLPRNVPCLQFSLLALISPLQLFPSPSASLAIGQTPTLLLLIELNFGSRIFLP